MKNLKLLAIVAIVLFLREKWRIKFENIFQ